MVWSAKNQPDLYLGIRGLSDLKATIHCPRPARPNWWRRYSFDSNARGEVARVLTERKGRHISQWRGASIAPGYTLEWNINIRGRSLYRRAEPATPDTVLLPVPTTDQSLDIAVLLGPSNATSGRYPREEQHQTHLVAEGRLVDGRFVWVVWCHLPEAPPANSAKQTLKFREDQGYMVPDLQPAEDDNIRGLLHGEQPAGNLKFWERRAEFHKKLPDR